MLRFLFLLFGKTYESEIVTTLKAQLEYEREVNRELVETLTSIAAPQRVIPNNEGNNTTANANIRAGMWGRRRAALELKDRLEAQAKVNSPNLGKSDKEVTEELEKELGIEETKTEAIS